MGRANSSIILVLLASFSVSHGSVGSPPTISVPWTLLAERATLPEPFGALVIKFLNPSNSTPRLSIALADGTVDVDESLLSDLSAPILVQITYSDPAQTASKKIEYFELLILTGDAYPVRFKPCNQDREESLERDIAVFRVSRDLDVSREIVSFRWLDECET